jgi:50S ribosomal subunit-associated GTPase HflX
MIDEMRERELRRLLDKVTSGREMIFVSAVKGTGLESIRDIVSQVQRRNVEISVTLPDTDPAHSLLSRLYEKADISAAVSEHGISVTVRCLSTDVDKFSAWLEAAGGTGLIVKGPSDGASS